MLKTKSEPCYLLCTCERRRDQNAKLNKNMCVYVSEFDGSKESVWFQEASHLGKALVI